MEKLNIFGLPNCCGFLAVRRDHGRLSWSHGEVFSMAMKKLDLKKNIRDFHHQTSRDYAVLVEAMSQNLLVLSHKIAEAMNAPSLRTHDGSSS